MWTVNSPQCSTEARTTRANPGPVSATELRATTAPRTRPTATKHTLSERKQNYLQPKSDRFFKTGRVWFRAKQQETILTHAVADMVTGPEMKDCPLFRLTSTWTDLSSSNRVPENQISRRCSTQIRATCDIDSEISLVQHVSIVMRAKWQLSSCSVKKMHIKGINELLNDGFHSKII